MASPPIIIPNPFDEFNRNMLALIAQQAQHQLDKERLKLEQQRLKIEQDRANAIQQREQAQGLAGQNILQLLASQSPELQTLLQRQFPQTTVDTRNLGNANVVSGSVVNQPFNAQNIPVNVAAGLAQQLQEFQTQQANLRQIEQQTTESKTRVELARGEAARETELFPLKKQLMQAQIDAQNASALADRARAAAAFREAKNIEREYQLKLRSFAREQIADSQKAFMNTVNIIKQFNPALSNSDAQLQASRLVYGTDIPPKMSVLMDQELQFLDRAAATFSTPEDFNSFLSERKLNEVGDRLGMSPEQQREIKRLLMNVNGDPQKVFDTYAKNRKIDEATLGTIALYLTSATGKSVNTTGARRKPFLSIPSIQIGPMQGFVGGAARGFVHPPPQNR